MHCGKQPDVQLCVQADAGTGSSHHLAAPPARLNTALGIISKVLGEPEVNMGEVVAFPSLSGRAFREFEEFLRTEKRLGPCESDVWDACMCEVRIHWDRMQTPKQHKLRISTIPELTVMQTEQLTSQLSDFAKEVEAAIQTSNAGNLVCIARLIYENTALKMGR